MESIGERLKSAREAKKLAIRDVAKETNIAPRYIEALEAEEFDRFPGETYISGFLRSYAEFLKIDADEMIQSYKGYKIGESATPLEELTRPTSTDVMTKIASLSQNYRKFVYIGGAVAAVLVIAGIYALISSSSVNLATDSSLENRMRSEAGEKGNVHELKLQNDKGFVAVKKDEAVQFLVDGKEVTFVVRDIKEKEIVIELLPQKQSETLALDTQKQISVAGATKPAFLTLKGLTSGSANIKVALGDAAGTDDGAAAPAQQPAQAQPAQGDTTTVVAQNAQNLKIVFEAEFSAKTYVELYLDGAEKMRGVVQPGSRQRWEATDLIQIKIGNAGGVKARINGKDYSFGLPGQVANKVVTWKKDPAKNQYEIVVRDWY